MRWMLVLTTDIWKAWNVDGWNEAEEYDQEQRIYRTIMNEETGWAFNVFIVLLKAVGLGFYLLFHFHDH